MVTAVLGCVNLPEPTEPDEGILIIPVRLVPNSNFNFDHFGYEIVVMGPYKLVGRYRVRTTTDMVFLKGLERGPYQFESLAVVEGWPRQDFFGGRRVEVFGQTITISHLYLEIRRTGAASRGSRISNSWRRTTPQIREEVLEKLRDDPEFDMWELHTP